MRIGLLLRDEIAGVSLSDLNSTHFAKWRDRGLQQASEASVIWEWQHSVCYTAANAIEPRPIAVCIKAVSDFADTDKHADGTEANKAYAALSEFVSTCPALSRSARYRVEVCQRPK